MRFESKDDVVMFLVECDQHDLIESATKDFTPSEEMIELFLKRRKKTVKHLKDFRRQQISRQQWRHNRYSMMKGIKSFHKSTKGKKFHRALARFISTRIPLTGQSILSLRHVGESYLRELGEVFKALASYKTHAWIQLENYMSVSDTADYEIFLEEVIQAVASIESELMKPNPALDASKVDFLLSTLNHNYVFDSLETEESSFDQLQETFTLSIEREKESEYPYLSVLAKLKQK